MQRALLAVIAVASTIVVALAAGFPIEAGFASAAVASLSFAVLGGRRPSLVAPNLVLAPLVVTIAHQHGVPGLVLATTMAGFFQVLLGVCNVGRALAAAPVAVIRALQVAAACTVLAGLATAPTFHHWPARPTGLFSVDVVALLPSALAIALVSALVTLGSREPRRHEDYDADLVAVGLANTACGLLGGIPVAAHALEVPRLHKGSRNDRLAMATILLVAASMGFTRAVLVAAVVALVAFARAHGRLVVSVQEGPVVVATLSGELFFASRAELAPLHELDTPVAMVLDVSKLSLVDASGVRALALLVDSLRARGCAVTVVADGALRTLLQA